MSSPGLRLLGVLLVGGPVLVLSVLLSLVIGSVDLDLATLIRVLQGTETGPAATILWELRLPRALLGAGVGSCLAMAGAALQAILRNPLADPYIVGTSAGAAFGATLAIILGLQQPVLGLSPIPLLAFLGALGAMAFVYRLATIDGVLPADTFLLSGVVVGAFLGSLVSFLMTLAHEELPRVVLWLMGSLELASWDRCALLVPYLLLGGGGLLALALTLNLMTLGEETALQLGVEVEKAKLRVVILAALLTAAAVSVSGLIGFLGLLVPHLARGLVGPDHRVLLPASAVGGAVFLVLADAAARTVAGSELPVGVITAGVGAPFFFLMLHRRKRLA
ncbi:MAG: iron ABC transporter permease [Armatimonadetes bacterium]|nr:iron ABC transporter permease [Armatimonadota bacterium]